MNFAKLLMNQLTYPKKMGLIAIVFLIPITILTWTVFNDETKIIDTTQTEQDALRYINTVLALYKNVPQHRGMTSAYLNGKNEFKTKILAKREQISANIAAIDAVDTELGTQFRTTALWTDIKQDWKQLSEQALRLRPQESLDRHTVLIIKIATLFEQASYYSGLALDPELNTARIIKTLVSNMPIITERLGRVRAIGSGIAAAGMMTMDSNLNINILLTEVDLNSQSAINELSAVMADNKQVAEALSDVLKQREMTMSLLYETINERILNSPLIQISPEIVFDLATDAINTNFQLYDQLLPILNDLFEQRISEASSHRNIILTITAVALLLASILFIGFFRSITSNIQQLSEATTTVSAGDLTIKMTSDAHDETTQIVTALNAMVTHLNETITRIGSTSGILSSAAEQLSATTKNVSTNISGQQMQTEQIATAMNEMTATVQDIAKNAELLAVEVANAEQETTSGSVVINNTILAINTLAEGVGNAANVVADLEQSSNEIGSILNVIKGVAEQTNLLALNAAIEAARAGEHGRGFAVVADEVRTLATRTQQSAEQIQEMVNTLQNNTRQASSVMNAERQKAEEMSVNTQAATNSLNNIVNSMAKISGMSAQVATAAEEQGSVSEEINRNVNIVSDLSSQNMTGTQEVSTASQSLADLATELDQIVRSFKV